MKLEYNVEIGRELGWDLARCGWAPREDANEDVIEGHKAGVAHFGRVRHVPDRFERKWLQLRQGALRRGRVEQPEITLQFIKAIDNAVCPVTLVRMTHGLRSGTDWSIDRINNDGGYADGNLVVISTLANKAKGDKSFHEVFDIGISLDEGQTIDGLNSRQWGRLASIMVGACVGPYEKAGRAFPLLTRIPAHSIATQYQALQALTYRVIDKPSTRDRFVKRFSQLQPDTSKVRLLRAAVRRLSVRVPRCEYRFDASLDVEFRTLLFKWHFSMPESMQSNYTRLLHRIGSAEDVSDDMITNWSLDTRGYFA